MHSLSIHPILRPMIALLAATVVTSALFYLMNSLIESGNVGIDDTPAIRFVEFVRASENTPELTIKAPVQKPPAPQPQPARPPVSPFHTGGGFSDRVEKILPPAPVNVSTTGLSDGEHLPLVKVHPNYPRSALARGLEGYVIVEFDVAPDGSVRNPRVIESQPSTIFNNAALKAVMKFRYKPMVENGKPITVVGVQNRFSFELDSSL